jgi:hypothetical protein
MSLAGLPVAKRPVLFLWSPIMQAGAAMSEMSGHLPVSQIPLRRSAFAQWT